MESDSTHRLPLLFLFGVPRVLTQPWAKLLQTQFFATRFAFVGVVVVAGFFANHEDGVGLFLAFGHRMRGIGG